VLFTTDDVGPAQGRAAAARLHALNPDTRSRRSTNGWRATRWPGGAAADVVLDCCDNFGTRFALNAACVAARKPLVSGAAIRYEGQLAVFRADLDPGQPCYRCLWEEDAEGLENCRGNGIFGPVTGVIGSMMAVEALKIASGCAPSADGRLMLYDAREGSWRSLRLERDPGCPVCGAA
jgi:molybdopterin-synthase adenylyltransferase